MKFQRMKDMICGALIASMVLCSGTVAFAKVANMNIPVSFSNIKIVVDGQQISTSKEPFTYEGTTYLPVRAVAEAVGKDVTWDGNTKTVYLNSAGTNEAHTATASYSRNNPAPVGIEQICTVDNFTEKYTAKVKIVDVYEGSNAWSKIKKANMFNEEAPAGKEYILAKVEVELLSSEDDKAISFSKFNFTPFSGENSEYNIASVVEPEHAFSGSAYEGGTVKGYISFLVDKDDDAPKVVFGDDYNGKGGVWFSLR